MKVKGLAKAVKFGQIGVTALVLKAVNQDLGRRYLIKELSRMPGIPSKMGQLLTMRFGKTEWQEFTPEPVSLSWVKNRIESECPLLAAEIDEIDSEGVLASLGQVHRATLKSGQTVAIKVRYPQVDEQVDEQLDLMFTAFQSAPQGIRRDLDIVAYEEFLKEFFHEELDYLKEAASQRRFREAWKSETRIVIPEALEHWSSRAILVQSYEPANDLSDLWGISHSARVECAALLSRFFLGGLFEKGLIHTDLHPKNWGFRPESGELVVYDFGATLAVPAEVTTALCDLAGGGLRSSNEYLMAFGQLGFAVEKLAVVADRLPELSAILFEPLRSNQPFIAAEWQVRERIESLLSGEKWSFRTSGPPWFLMAMRSFNGWLYAMKQLRVETGLRRFYPGEIHDRGPLYDGAQHQISSLGGPKDGQASTLHVRVTEAGVEVVALEFPARSVASIEDMMPEHVIDALSATEIDLAEIKNRAESSGLKAQLLFELDRGKRNYRVWLD